jgi:hypothetical protein
MEKKDWLALCAVHSDAWIMSVLFFYAARFDDAGRAELFSLVNQHPTIYEVVTGRVNKNKTYKRKQLIGAQPSYLPHAAQPQPDLPAILLQQHQAVSSDKPNPAGKLLTFDDVTPALVGKQAELFWPDDAKWYLVQFTDLVVATREATYVVLIE